MTVTIAQSIRDDPADIDATIAIWKAQGLSADDAWRALGNRMAWAVEWREVRAFMLQWLEVPSLRRAA